MSVIRRGAARESIHKICPGQVVVEIGSPSGGFVLRLDSGITGLVVLIREIDLWS